MLNKLKDDIRSCKKCHLRATTKISCWDENGNFESKVMFVAEAPGKNEAEVGIPFVGKAGEYLNRCLLGIGLSREKILMSNTVMCRPTDGARDRTPTDEEIAICSPYLHQQITLVKPRLIVALGRVSMTTLINKKISLSPVKATLLDYCYDSDIKVFPMWHPSFIISYGGDDIIKQNWEDWKTLKRAIDELNI